MAAKIPAAAYYRMSSDKQETSIADQRSAVQEYAQQNNYRIVREYQDAGVSGWKSQERVGFQQMIDDAQHGEFQAVLCWDVDRFSRFPVLEANHYWYLLDRVGVHLATIAQGRLDFESIGGFLQASVTQFGKNEYCKDLARNVSRGLRKRREAGKWLGSVPQGYTSADGKLVPGPPEAVALVRRIFDTRAKGYGIHTIAKQLNDENVPTPRGRPWSYQSVKHILQREAYIGNLVAGAKSRARFQQALEPGFRMEGTHEPLIDRELWNKVQEVPTKPRRAHDRNGGTSSPLAGLVTCGGCGCPMYQSNHSAKWRYFVCSTGHKAQGCGRNSMPSEKLEAVVYAKLRATVLAGSMERLTAAIQRVLDRRPKPVNNSKQIAKLDAQIERAAGRLLAVDDSLVPDLEKQLLLMKTRREQLSAIEPTAATLPAAEKIAAKVWELDRILRESPPTEVREVLRQIIEDIELQFVVDGGTAKRRHYRCTGGMIKLRSFEARRQAGTPWNEAPG